MLALESESIAREKASVSRRNRRGAKEDTVGDSNQINVLSQRWLDMLDQSLGGLDNDECANFVMCWNGKKADVISWMCGVAAALLDLARSKKMRTQSWPLLLETLCFLLVDTRHLGSCPLDALLLRSQPVSEWPARQIAEAVVILAEQSFYELKTLVCDHGPVAENTLVSRLSALYALALSNGFWQISNTADGSIDLCVRLAWLQSHEQETIQRSSEKASFHMHQCVELLQRHSSIVSVATSTAERSISLDSVRREMIRLQSTSFFLECDELYAHGRHDAVISKLMPVINHGI